MPKRKIIEIDEAKCDGCGLCVPGCAEGALQIIDGKAKLVSETYCDGLGACLGECPQGAIQIVEREAPAFDEAAVQQHLADAGKLPVGAATASVACPGAKVQSFSLPLVEMNSSPPSTSPDPQLAGEDASSALRHWPVQLRLIPPGAPFLRGAHLLLVADCVPVAMPDFQRLLAGRAVALACPKFDNAQDHIARLTAILAEAAVESVTVVRIQVPCCSGLRSIAQTAINASGRQVPLGDIVISTRGEVLSDTQSDIDR